MSQFSPTWKIRMTEQVQRLPLMLHIIILNKKYLFIDIIYIQLNVGIFFLKEYKSTNFNKFLIFSNFLQIIFC